MKNHIINPLTKRQHPISFDIVDPARDYVRMKWQLVHLKVEDDNWFSSCKGTSYKILPFLQLLPNESAGTELILALHIHIYTIDRPKVVAVSCHDAYVLYNVTKRKSFVDDDGLANILSRIRS